MSELRMAAYYYAFDRTDVAEIDRILSAVACAGKAFHHTDNWTDDCAPYEGHTGSSPVDWIQNAGTDAARTIESLRAQLAEAQKQAKVARCRADTLEDYATSRLCSDHRDKWPRGTCVMCELAEAQQKLVGAGRCGAFRTDVPWQCVRENDHEGHHLFGMVEEKQELDKLREFVAAFRAWANSDELCGGPLFDAMLEQHDLLEKRAAVGD